MISILTLSSPHFNRTCISTQMDVLYQRNLTMTITLIKARGISVRSVYFSLPIELGLSLNHQQCPVCGEHSLRELRRPPHMTQKDRNRLPSGPPRRRHIVFATRLPHTHSSSIAFALTLLQSKALSFRQRRRTRRDDFNEPSQTIIFQSN